MRDPKKSSEARLFSHDPDSEGIHRGCPSRSKDDRNPNSSRSRSERGGSSFFLSFYRQVCTRRTILPFSFSPWTWNSLTSRQENLGTRRFHEEEKQRSIFLQLLNDKISSLLNITDFCIKVLSRNVSKLTYAATKWNLLNLFSRKHEFPYPAKHWLSINQSWRDNWANAPLLQPKGDVATVSRKRFRS